MNLRTGIKILNDKCMIFGKVRIGHFFTFIRTICMRCTCQTSNGYSLIFFRNSIVINKKKTG